MFAKHQKLFADVILIIFLTHSQLLEVTTAQNSSLSTANVTFQAKTPTAARSGKKKVRVNILYLSRQVEAPMLRPETYGQHLNSLDPSTPNDIYYGSVPWVGNDQLENVEAYVSLVDTKYDTNFNLQLTMSSVLDLLLTKSSCNCNQNTTSTVAVVRNPTAIASSNGPVVHIIAGPGFSSEVKVISQITSYYNLVIIAGSASSWTLSDRSRYPYFFRTCPPDSDGPDVVANILTYFGYDQLSAFYQDETFILDFRSLLEPNFRARGIQLENSFVYHFHDNRTYFNLANVLGFSAKSRVWFAPRSTTQWEFFCALHKFGDISGTKYLGVLWGPATGATWILPPPVPVSGPDLFLYRNDCSRDDIAEVMQGSLLVSPGEADFEDRPADMFRDKIGGLRPTKFYSDLEKVIGSRMPSFLFFLFDAVTAAALALDRAERDLQAKLNTSLAYFRYNDTRVVKIVHEQLTNMTFQGLTGAVAFSGIGNRLFTGYLLSQFQDTNFVTVGRYIPKNSSSYNLTFHRSLIFPTVDGKPPPQFAAVESWATPLNIFLTATGAALLLLFITFGFLYTRHRISQSALHSVLGNVDKWFIDQSMLMTDERSSVILTSGSVASGSNASLSHRRLSRGSSVLNNDSGKQSLYNVSFVPNPFLPYKYEGERVCLFALQQRREQQGQQRGNSSTGAVVINREFASELLLAQTCSNHDNLSRFVGVARMLLSEPPGLMYVVMSGSSKGTLCQFLNQSDAGLDETCSFSFLKDLQKGLVEVHKRIGYHGRLSSTVCMIDNRLSLRVNDYGFGMYRKANFFATDSSNYENWLWTAPEILQTFTIKPENADDEQTNAAYESMPNMTTNLSKVDIYSFGIISVEIFTQCSPPFEEQLGTMAVQQLLASIIHEPDTARSLSLEAMSLHGCAKDIVEFVLSCLKGDAAQRSTLSEIGVALRTMMKTRNLSDNLTDMLMKRLETYATDLASLVDQRTAALVEEEKKVRRLLYQILPPSVADALKNGQSVPPQTDIVGFTTISAMSTPLEIVDFLNDLYMTFDLIISKFDVYKVETIGDAYMVASGLPRPNELEHARHIVRMSIALVWHVTNAFKIRHRPGEQLLLRIGLHSGPCAAGVVGFVMPRYCLFGDTVNTASRMESTGEALKIHASEATAKVLRELEARSNASAPEFQLEARGEIAVKGKGVMQTYWITKPT